MPSIYLPVFKCATSFVVTLDCGTFNVPADEEDDYPDAPDGETFMRAGRVISRYVHRQMISAKNELRRADILDVQAKNAERAENLRHMAAASLRRRNTANAQQLNTLEYTIRKKRAQVEQLQTDIEMLENKLKLMQIMPVKK